MSEHQPFIISGTARWHNEKSGELVTLGSGGVVISGSEAPLIGTYLTGEIQPSNCPHVFRVTGVVVASFDNIFALKFVREVQGLDKFLGSLRSALQSVPIPSRRGAAGSVGMRARAERLFTETVRWRA
jgi:hypothetical protein